MNWSHAMIVALAVIDLCALGVGVTILRKVTRTVEENGIAIREAVMEGIEEAKETAVAKFMVAVGPALGKIAETVPGVIKTAVETTLSKSISVQVQGGGQVVVEPEPDGGLTVVEGKGA